MLHRRGHYRLATLTATAVATLTIGPSAASNTSANAVHNAGITWGNFETILGANVDGSGRNVVGCCRSDDAGDPAWTRDGRALAYFLRYSDTVKIYVTWPGTRKYRVLGAGSLLQHDSLAYIEEPTWSPDATRIAVSDVWHCCTTTAAAIRIVSLATKKWTSVTKPRLHQADVDPAWSPDGRTIAYARSQHYGTPTLYLVRPDGSGARRLTKGGSPSWSPDGKRLAFVLRGSVYEIRADGRGRKRILHGLRNPVVGTGFSLLQYPVVRWSPDGRKLLYTSGLDRRLRTDVWTADIDGTHRRRILHRVAVHGIAWRPGS